MKSKIETEVDNEIPNAYCCPISNVIMMDPVIIEDGHTYEREQIESWFEKNSTSPLTGSIVNRSVMIPNRNLREKIMEYLAQNLDIYQSDMTYMPQNWITSFKDALKNNQVQEAQRLLDNDRRLLTVFLEKQYSAFHFAAEFGSIALTEMVVSRIIRYNYVDKVASLPIPDGFQAVYLNSLIVQSLEKNKQEMLPILARLGADFEQIEIHSGNSLLHKFTEQGNVSAVEKLLSIPVNIRENHAGDTPLHFAVLHQQPKILELLLSRGVSLTENKKHQTPITLAILQDDRQILDLLIAKEKRNMPAVHLSIVLKDAVALNFLITHKKGILEERDVEGKTALYVAIAHQNLVAANSLLRAGADVNAPCGKEKRTPVHLAVELGAKEIVELLLVNAQPNMGDEKGNTALHSAVKGKDRAIIDLLIKAGFNPDATNKDGQSPFEWASREDKTAYGMRSVANRFYFFPQGAESNAICLKTIQAHEDVIYSMAALQDGQFATAAWDKTIKVWKAGQCLLTLKGHARHVTCIQEIDRDTLASGSTDKTIKIWDLKTGNCINTLTHQGNIRCLKRLSHGLLASGSSDHTIKVWDIKTMRCVKTLTGHTDSINSLEDLSHGKLASGSWDKTIKIWDIAKGACVKTLTGHTEVVRSLLHLSNGQLVSASRDKTLKFWDIHQGVCHRTVQSHTDAVNCLYALKNGYLLSGSWDKTIKIWDVQNGICLHSLEGHTGSVNALLELNPNLLVSSSDDQCLKFWDISSLLQPQQSNHLKLT